jgi:hypothetical protein
MVNMGVPQIAASYISCDVYVHPPFELVRNSPGDCNNS